ncbi:MAG: hypothetical protein MZU91_06460 [Desulfosudis oleivorans]|nr:hypothetical protein [Desulfosudis oleivorans]
MFQVSGRRLRAGRLVGIPRRSSIPARQRRRARTRRIDARRHCWRLAPVAMAPARRRWSARARGRRSGGVLGSLLFLHRA